MAHCNTIATPCRAGRIRPKATPRKPRTYQQGVMVGPVFWPQGGLPRKGTSPLQARVACVWLEFAA